MKVLIITLFSLLLFTEISFAQQQGQRRTVIDFDDELVEGEISRPDLSYLLQTRQFNFGRLIKLRENFLPEMKSTAEDIERGR